MEENWIPRIGDLVETNHTTERECWIIISTDKSHKAFCLRLCSSTTYKDLYIGINQLRGNYSLVIRGGDENRFYTYPEEANMLINLGLDIKTADMCYRISTEPPGVSQTLLAYPLTQLQIEHPHEKNCEWIPAWSLTALLRLLPNWWVFTKSNSEQFTLEPHGGSTKYKDPVSTAFNAVCLLLAKRHDSKQQETDVEF